MNQRSTITGGKFACAALSLLAIQWTVSPLPSSAASERTYQVDPALSYLELHMTAHVQGELFDLQPQAPGSLRAGLSGNVRLVFDTPNTFTMPDDHGIAVVLAQQPGVFEPGGLAGNLAGFADYSSLVPGGRTDVLISDALFNLKTLQATPISIDSAGNFSTDMLGAEMLYPSRLRLRDPNLELNWTLRENLDSLPGGQGSITESGGQSRFEIPIGTAPVFLPFISNPAYEVAVTGHLVAFAEVPEPATWLLAAIGAAGLMLRRFPPRDR